MEKSQAVTPATSPSDQTQMEIGAKTITAQNGGVVNTPQFTGNNFGNNAHVTVSVNNICPELLKQLTHPRGDETIAATVKPKDNIQRCQEELKSYLLDLTKNLSQGTKEETSSTPLNKIYTELYITEGGSGEVNSEHEVIELECTRCTSEERKIPLNDIFKPLSDEENPPQRVLTKGIAGIGKTVAVQKFTHDWAAGTANQKIQLIFPFTFRDLNLIKDETLSLIDLIHRYFEEVEDLEMSDYKNSSILFIFDGLDESKFPLDFENNKMCRRIKETTTVDVLLTNLIKGKLLHKASIWITSRPAAASKIPAEFINRVTEVRGFNDKQKEEYFQKKMCNKIMAQKIFDHLHSKPLRSLYIMCHIPVFCWISATALQSLLTDSHQTELPKNLTEMYTHFLIIQTKRTQQKDYQKSEIDKDLIMKLGKLAFEQLQEGNIIFYEKDLKACKIDLKQAALYSGICTQIIRKECGLHKQEVYSFIHLSVQEFLAALYVLETFMDSRENLLSSKSVKLKSQNGEIPIIFLHKNAVDQALASDYGQWDLFLRFLLGLSQDKNQKLLQKVFGSKERRSQSSQETISYIHQKIKKLSYTDKSISLFHCLNELGDQSLVEQVQKYQRSGDVSKISPSHWSALAFILLVSNEDLSVFNLKKYYGSDEILERLLPLLKASKTALLTDCNLTERCSKYISSVLSVKSSGLEELDLSKNNLLDSGMKLLSEGLQSQNCKLRTLSLKQCSITMKGCQFLASGLASNPSHLRELDLSNNTFLDEGLELILQVLNKCSLETLRLCECGITENGCKHLASTLRLNPSHLKNLDLSRNHLGDMAVTQLSDFLKHPDCQLQRLCLFKTDLRKESAAVLASALNPSHLKELDLGGNILEDAGVMKIAELLKHPDCKLNTLRLAGCRFTESGCAALASSLKSNPAHLRVLDLTRNNLRDASIETLSQFLADERCQLETLNLKCCSLTAAGCRSLTSALSRSSALKELDLSHNILTDQGLMLLSDWLKQPECKLEILRLSGLTESSCEYLASALRSNPPHLRELVLSKSHLEESGLKPLTDLQERKQFKLHTLTEGSNITKGTLTEAKLGRVDLIHKIYS